MILHDLMQELALGLPALEAQRDGFNHLATQAVGEETKQAVRHLQAVWEEHIGLRVEALKALTTLAEARYPDMPPVELPPEYYAELAEQKAEVDAAWALVVPPVTRPVVGSVELKE